MRAGAIVWSSLASEMGSRAFIGRGTNARPGPANRAIGRVTRCCKSLGSVRSSAACFRKAQAACDEGVARARKAFGASRPARLGLGGVATMPPRAHLGANVSRLGDLAQSEAR